MNLWGESEGLAHTDASHPSGCPGFIRLTLGETELHSTGGRKHFSFTHQEREEQDHRARPRAALMGAGSEQRLGAKYAECWVDGIRKEIVHASMSWELVVRGKWRQTPTQHDHALQKLAYISHGHPRLCPRVQRWGGSEDPPENPSVWWGGGGIKRRLLEQSGWEMLVEVRNCSERVKQYTHPGLKSFVVEVSGDVQIWGQCGAPTCSRRWTAYETLFANNQTFCA